MTNRFTHHAFTIVALFVVTATLAFAQRKAPTADQMLSVNGAQGTEFWITIPPNELLPYNVSALEVYVASAFDTEVTVFDAAGQQQYKRKIIAGEVRTLNDQRGETNWTWEVRDYEVVVTKGIRLTADKPISVYVLNAKPFSSEGYLAIPTSVWGKEYIATSYYDYAENRPWGGGFVIIAKKQGTVVDVLLRGEEGGGGRTRGGRRIGDRFQVTLNAGDVYNVVGDGLTRDFDLSGSLITATEPIGLYSYHMRSTMPNTMGFSSRDHLCEMTPPLQTWGKKYVSVEYNRVPRNPNGKGDLFRVYASEPDTKWTLTYYDKTTKAVLGRGGGVLRRAGEVATVTHTAAPTFITHGYSVWEADKPIFVMQFANSAGFDGDNFHDPFMINVVPEEQFIPNTIFQTPTDAKFTTHYLNLIVKADTSDPDYIDNLKSLEIDGKPVWNHPKAANPGLLTNHMGKNLHWVTIIFGTEAIAHRIKGNGKVTFGGYIYGFGTFDSYGWPAASGFRPVSILDTMPPLLTADTLCGDFDYTATEFRNIPNPPRNPPGDSDQVETGISSIEFTDNPMNNNYRIVLETSDEFPRDPAFFEFAFKLEVIDKSQDAWAEFVVRDYADNFTIDTVFFFADDLVFTPNPLKFQEIRVGTKKRLDVTVRNQSEGPVTLTESEMQVGTYYAIVGGLLPPEVSLEPGQSHVLTIEYSGDRETSNVLADFDIDTLIVKTECGEFKIGIDGVASLPCLVVEDFDAGTNAVGARKCKTGGLRLRNPGSDTTVITAINGYLGTNFSLSNPFTPALPITILPGQSVDLKDVCFQRNDVGRDSIDVVFVSNAAGAPDLLECTTYDPVSTWKGRTTAPGPIITGYDWGRRRENTLHPEFREVMVLNTGTQPITLTSVVFQAGNGVYFPAGTNETNYVFKIGDIIVNGAPTTNVALSNTDTAFVQVYFRPAASVTYDAIILPRWQEQSVPAVTNNLLGEGTLPTIATQGAFINCDESPEGETVPMNLEIRNDGNEDLTVSNLRFAAGTNPAWAFAVAPANPLMVPANGGTQTVVVNFTRPVGNNLGFNLTVEFEHDAVRGDGNTTTITPIAGNEAFGVGSCSGPDIAVTDLDFGRQLATCDQPLLDFTITNTGGGNVPLEIRDLVPTGANAGAYNIVNIVGPDGTPVAVPFTIPAGQRATVTVRFTPILPDAVPWADFNYDAQIRVMNYVEGGTDELRPDLYVDLRGTGFVIPVNFVLTNSTDGRVINPGDDDGEASNIVFSVRAISGNWQRAALTDYIVDVIFETKAIAIDRNNIAVRNNWQQAVPVDIQPIDDTRSRARFTLTDAGAGPVQGDGFVLTFGATLLLGQNFFSEQDLEVDLLRGCLVPSTQGTSTEITNCALAKRVIDISGTQFAFRPISPNPVSSGVGSVDFGVGINAPTTIELVDASGTVVRTFIDQTLTAGEYTLTFPTQEIGSGTYFLRMSSADYSSSQKLIIAK